MVSCQFCQKDFKTKFNSRRHQKICMMSPEIVKTENYFCQICFKTFTRRDHVTSHLRACSKDKQKKRIACLYDFCEETFFWKTTLIQHLKNIHGALIEDKKSLEFTDEEQFKEWKYEEEERTFSFFSQQSGSRNNIKFFYCQRDGSSKPHTKNGERKTDRRNAKGRIKEDFTCTARIRVETDVSGKVKVEYEPTHTHPLLATDLQLGSLSAKTNTDIAEQLAIESAIDDLLEKKKSLVINNLSKLLELVKNTDFPFSTLTKFETLSIEMLSCSNIVCMDENVDLAPKMISSQNYNGYQKLQNQVVTPFPKRKRKNTAELSHHSHKIKKQILEEIIVENDEEREGSFETKTMIADHDCWFDNENVAENKS